MEAVAAAAGGTTSGQPELLPGFRLQLRAPKFFFSLNFLWRPHNKIHFFNKMFGIGKLVNDE